MNRRDLIVSLAAAAVTWPLAARAQRVEMPTIGFLNSASRAPFASIRIRPNRRMSV